MKRIVLCLALVGCGVSLFAGCASDSDKASWAKAKGDWNGDNMKMKNDFGSPSTLDSKLMQPKASP